MNKKQGIIFLVVLLVLIGVVALNLSRDTGGPGGPEKRTMPREEGGTPAQGGMGGSETFSPEVPKDVVITPPAVEAPAAPGVEAKLRIFDMTVAGEGYVPEQIVVNRGDTITIRLASAFQDYDIALPDLGLYQMVKKGEKKQIGFQALTSGTFTYQCRDYCPGGTLIKGSLIVK